MSPGFAVVVIRFSICVSGLHFIRLTEIFADPMDYQQESEDDHMEQKIINEEYKIWKKNSVWLYDQLYA